MTDTIIYKPTGQEHLDIFPFDTFEPDRIQQTEFFHRIAKSIQVSFVIMECIRVEEIKEFIKSVEEHICSFEARVKGETQIVKFATEVIIASGTKDLWAGEFNNAFFLSESQEKIYRHRPLTAVRGFFIYIIDSTTDLDLEAFCNEIYNMVKEDRDHGHCCGSEIITKNSAEYNSLLIGKDQHGRISTPEISESIYEELKESSA